jgi:DNA-binding CsgD family transcriptional regulator
LQVALIVAEGATNKEAAVKLFLSPKTIDYHLGNVYRKLGVRTRTQLSRRLADRGMHSAAVSSRSREPTRHVPDPAASERP